MRACLVVRSEYTWIEVNLWVAIRKCQHTGAKKVCTLSTAKCLGII